MYSRRRGSFDELWYLKLWHPKSKLDVPQLTSFNMTDEISWISTHFENESLMDLPVTATPNRMVWTSIYWLAHEMYGRNSLSIISKPIIHDSNLSISCEIAVRWMPHNLTNKKSALVQVLVWRCQAASQYLNQCWPRSMSPYDITRPQC